MKHLNLIGASIAAAVSLSVLAACDSRGVTAMKSRVYTPEEIAAEKLRRQGQVQTRRAGDQNLPVTTPAPAPSNTPDQANRSDRDPVVSDKEAGSAQGKLFNEDKNGVAVASKSEILELAKQQLGKVSQDATDLLKGLTIVDKSAPGKPRVEINAILLPDDRALELHAEFDVDTTDKDVINGKSDVAIGDLSANADVDPSRVTVATVCSEVEKGACKKVILIFSAAAGQRSKDALVEVTLGKAGEVPNAALVTNAGLLASFIDAQNKFAAKMDDKADKTSETKATIKTVARPGVPFAGDVKGKPVSKEEYKAFAAKYAEWKKAQTDAAQWAKHPRPAAKPAAAPAPAATPAPAPQAQPAPAAAVKTAAPQMPSAEERKSMTRGQLQARIKAYEASVPVPLPNAEKSAILNAAKRNDLPLTEVKTIDAKDVAQVKATDGGPTKEAQDLAQKKAANEALPFYKRVFTKWYWWPEDKAAEIRAGVPQK